MIIILKTLFFKSVQGLVGESSDWGSVRMENLMPQFLFYIICLSDKYLTCDAVGPVAEGTLEYVHIIL